MNDQSQNNRTSTRDFDQDTKFGAVSSRVERAHRNEMDHEAFIEFRGSFTENFDKTKTRIIKRRIKEALLWWYENSPSRYSGARVEDLKTSARKAALKVFESSKNPLCFYVSGKAGSGKTYAVYAIIGKMIVRRVLDPTKVLLISERDIVGMVDSGFDGLKRLDNMLSKHYSAIVVEDAGVTSPYRAEDVMALSRFVEKAYNEETPMVITSTVAMNRFAAVFDKQTGEKISEMFEDAEINL